MAIKLDNRDGYASTKTLMAKEKANLILSVLSDEPLTAIQIAEKTKLFLPTVRHHLYLLEKRNQLVAKCMLRVVGDQAKRYFAFGTDLSNIETQRVHRNKFAAREKAMCDFMRNCLRHKMEIVTQFDLKRKTTETILREMQLEGLLKVMKAKQFPWRAAVQFYYAADSDMDLILKSKQEIESKYAHMTRLEFSKDRPIYEKEPEIPELPDNLLAMMGYTKHKPTTGQQFNVDQYSANHPNWNKYQTRKGLERSNMGCSMQMMIESAPGTI